MSIQRREQRACPRRRKLIPTHDARMWDEPQQRQVGQCVVRVRVMTGHPPSQRWFTGSNAVNLAIHESGRQATSMLRHFP